ncbi:MAG TPA: signal peptidase I [Candidatus Nanoarchaeia archaeon]|nr:signal peptidase I [Candidatus Nanoarchaeia archaeon]
MKEKLKENGRRAWKFFWQDDSAASWIANIIVAFIVIRFVVYPLLGAVLGTNFPIVAVVSESMEHGLGPNGDICGNVFYEFRQSFDNYWEACGSWYEKEGITTEVFSAFPFQNGFDKGDVIILWRANKENIELGDILVFQADKPQPIIHRVVKVWQEDDAYFYQTKGDHNSDSITNGMGETKISESRIYGKGLIRVPYLGWLKILFVDAVKPLGLTIVR